MRTRLIALGAALALALAPMISGGARAADACPRLPAGLRCAPLPDDAGARRQALQALDVDGRDAVSRGDYAGAAAAFGCLVEGDPTPESAGNLAVVLREQGTLGDALLIARCAEQLAAAGSPRERARVRRVEIEHRLGLPATAAPVPAAATDLTAPASDEPPSDSRPAASTSPRLHRGWSYAGLAFGLAALIGSGVLYALARERARQFGDEQRASGFSERARTLRDDARTLEIGSWVGAGVGAAAAVTGGVLLTF